MFHKRTQLVVLNMSYRSEWEGGVVNRNKHIVDQLITREQFHTIVLVDFLPFTLRKKIKFLLTQKPWRKTAQTVQKGFTWQLTRDETRPHIYYYKGTSHDRLPEIFRSLQLTQEQLVVWSYNPLTSWAFPGYEKALRIFDAVDNWIEHPSYAKFTERLHTAYDDIRKTADSIFTVSQALVEFFGSSEKIVYIPNAVDAQHFHSASCSYKDAPSLKGPVIGYHGIIQDRLNFSLIEYLVQKHQDYQFVFAGTIWKDVKKSVDALKKYPNVHFYGFVPYAELPSLVSCFDVAIIPHVVDRFTQSMNPLKMYEYLAAGKPIVSTAVAGAEQLGDLLSLAVSPEDFSRLVSEHLQDDSVERMERRMRAAEQHSWDARYDTMSASLASLAEQQSIVL